MSLYIPDLRTQNVALYTVPLYWLIAISPRLYGMTLFERKTKTKMDSRTPRGFAQQASTTQKLEQQTKDLIGRTEAAMLNGFENFGPFTAAVVAGSAARLEPATMNALTFAYLGSRVVYNILYINNTTNVLAKLRSLSYMVGLGCLCAMFAKAGAKFNASVL